MGDEQHFFQPFNTGNTQETSPRVHRPHTAATVNWGRGPRICLKKKKYRMFLMLKTSGLHIWKLRGAANGGLSLYQTPNEYNHPRVGGVGIGAAVGGLCPHQVSFLS